MKNSKLILFENTQANFRLSVDTMYEKQKQDGTVQNTVYINPQKESGTFRPSCFLVFTYLTDDFNTTKGVYTTVPHMYRIRQAFETMHQFLNDPNAFIDIEGALGIAPSYSQPIVVDNLSMKNNDWLSLTLSTYKDQTSLVNRPGVAIQHSKSNGYSSLLTGEEFESIYDTIIHMDFVSLENQAVIIELLSRTGMRAPAQQPQPANNFANYVNNAAPNAGRYPTNNYQPRTGYTASRAATPAYQTQVPQPTVQAAAVPQPARTSPTQQSSLPPRPATSGPKITMESVKDIEVEDMSLDDSDAVSAIFNEEE